MPFEIQAHRGARAFYPENTIPAFCKAADLGCRVIELDLCVSQDHRIVVSHDPWLNEAQGASVTRRLLYTMPYERITEFDCGTPSPDFPRQQRIRAHRPSLTEVFREVEAHLDRSGRTGAMTYNLEVKSKPGLEGVVFPAPDDYASLVVSGILGSGLSGRVRLQSFDSRVVAAAHRLAPDLCYGYLVDALSALDEFFGCLGFVPAYVNPHHTLVDRALVERLHGFGCRVVVWTVNEPEEMVRMRRLGADGIITDHPEVALALPELA